MYKTVIILVEEQSEETFIRDTVAPAFAQLNIWLDTRNFKGNIKFDRFLAYARNTLKERSDTIISTMLDFYALKNQFPGHANIDKFPDLYDKVEHLERELHQCIIQECQCPPERFIPHIQPHEFEGLLFSDTQKLSRIEPAWQKQAEKLQAIRDTFDTPEHINNSYHTSPARRLENLLSPKYRKTRHGPIAAQKITLAVIERECPHFHQWMERLRAL